MQSMAEVAWLVLPEALLIGVACLMFLGGGFGGRRQLWAMAALLGHIGASAAWLLVPVEPAAGLRHLLFRIDGLTLVGRGVGLAAGALFVLLSWRQIDRRYAAEFFASLLLIIAGVNLVAAANDLIILFLALELISIPTYLLLYLAKEDNAAHEAAVKYFLLSVFSSAFTLFGFSYLYGSFGTTNLTGIQEAAAGMVGALPNTVVVGLVTAISGLAFRLAAVPFHFYAPDVYQGAPVVGAALLAFLPKLAGLAALHAIVVAVLMPGYWTEVGGVADQMTLLLWLLAVASMFLGNLLALLQDNLKRLLAYSSIAHAGYLLIGFAAGRHPRAWITGFEAAWYYLAVYGIMTIGAFAVLVYLHRSERPVESIDDLAGLGRSHPIAAMSMAVFMFSLTGLPPTAGFWGKLNLFFAAWFEGRFLFQLLAMLLAVNAAIAGYYYLRVVGAMYLRSPVKPLPASQDWPALAVVLLCLAATVSGFVFPEGLRILAVYAAA